MPKNINPRDQKQNDQKQKAIPIPRIDSYSSRKEWEEACWKKLLRSHKWLSKLATPLNAEF